MGLAIEYRYMYKYILYTLLLKAFENSLWLWLWHVIVELVIAKLHIIYIHFVFPFSITINMIAKTLEKVLCIDSGGSW